LPPMSCQSFGTFRPPTIQASSPSDPMDRLCSTDPIESVGIWAVEMNLWTRNDTPLPALGEPRRSHPGAAQGSGSDRWTTHKARDGNVPNCQGAVRISRLDVHFNTGD
jgi:hypothetical protein